MLPSTNKTGSIGHAVRDLEIIMPLVLAELINMPHLAHHLSMFTRSLLSEASMVGYSQGEETLITREESSAEPTKTFSSKGGRDLM